MKSNICSICPEQAPTAKSMPVGEGGALVREGRAWEVEEGVFGVELHVFGWDPTPTGRTMPHLDPKDIGRPQS